MDYHKSVKAYMNNSMLANQAKMMERTQYARINRGAISSNRRTISRITDSISQNKGNSVHFDH